LTISIIRNGLNLIRVSSFAQMMVIGAIIVIAVIIDSTGKKKAA
jgi:ribose/xylose/arabinose/galactoside ABC-type transport system permease subunit